MKTDRKLCKLTIAAIALATALLSWDTAFAYQLKTLYTFCADGGVCTDGQNPIARLTMDPAGNLFGVTNGGGHEFRGTVFELTVNADKTKWKHRVLHEFCGDSGCDDGAYPTGGLIIDTAGDLYGMTSENYPSKGTAFELVPKDKTSWEFRALHIFCPAGGSDCPDGARPFDGLTYVGADSGGPYDGVSTLFGTTHDGGSTGNGTVFALTPGKKAWREKVIYSFCSAQDCTDGAAPYGDLIADPAGNLYGTTQFGGAQDSGTVFQLSHKAGKSEWTLKVLYSFCSRTDCADGAYPQIALLRDTFGNLYGTTPQGGIADGGTAFKLAPHGKKFRFTLLYSFCTRPNCPDGPAQPFAPLSMDKNGTLFGTTVNGGNDEQAGTAFELGADGHLTQLYAFCGRANCTDGVWPEAPLLIDEVGNLFGSTYRGGKYSDYGGTIFELMP